VPGRFVFRVSVTALTNVNAITFPPPRPANVPYVWHGLSRGWAGKMRHREFLVLAGGAATAGPLKARARLTTVPDKLLALADEAIQ